MDSQNSLTIQLHLKSLYAGVPSPVQRKEILYTLLNEIDHSLKDEEINDLATVTHGFVGADLAALCNEAALICLRRYANFKKTYDPYSDNITEQPGLMNGETHLRDHSGVVTSSVLDETVSSSHVLPTSTMGTTEIMEMIPDNCEEKLMLRVISEDFQKARMKIRPSAMREVCIMM